MINPPTLSKELLILSKNTRHLSNADVWDRICAMSEEEKDAELKYVFGTISSSWEFVNYTFLLQDVTRGFTHQLVRHRAGTAFAQQSMRVTAAESFRYFVPDNLEKDDFHVAIYDATMTNIQDGYNVLLHKGVDIQDARGVLPTNICTNILFGVNLRALSTLMETRLCVRAQGEFQQVALIMREMVKEIHPWAAQALLPICVSKGYCAFSNYEECALKRKYPHLQPVDENLKIDTANDWLKLMEAGYSPQPKQQSII